jgi:hypothetical protein
VIAIEHDCRIRGMHAIAEGSRLMGCELKREEGEEGGEKGKKIFK